jgi:hypothetical protein
MNHWVLSLKNSQHQDDIVSRKKGKFKAMQTDAFLPSCLFNLIARIPVVNKTCISGFTLVTCALPLSQILNIHYVGIP